MPIISSPEEFNEDGLYVDLRSIFGHSLVLKCEGFNFAGSVKLKAAAEMVEAAEQDGRLRPGSFLVESSSGNLGVALSVIAASNGYRFLCVTDSRCNLTTRRLMEALGSRVHIITEPDPVGGLPRCARRTTSGSCAPSTTATCGSTSTPTRTPGRRTTARRRRRSPASSRNLDVLFVGAGTTGTLMGCARFFKQRRPSVRIVAIDTVGSVTFGAAPARRMIPGLGTSMRPPLLDESFVDEVIYIEEADTIRTCHRLARHGFLFGGSTGTVVSGAMSWLAAHDGDDLTAVAIAPDFGERYLDTVYQTNWVADLYGATSSSRTSWRPIPNWPDRHRPVGTFGSRSSYGGKSGRRSYGRVTPTCLRPCGGAAHDAGAAGAGRHR